MAKAFATVVLFGNVVMSASGCSVSESHSSDASHVRNADIPVSEHAV
jgi:hypothetical protein